MSLMTVLRGRDDTPDSHLFPTRPYDLVKEFVIALAVITALTVVMAVAFGSPDRKAITLKAWADAAPADVVATATAELAGTSTSAAYGAPYDSLSDGQKIGPLALQKWSGVRIPVNSADDLVIKPLAAGPADPSLTSALATWRSADPAQQGAWAGAYADALAAAPGNDPARVKAGKYGPTPVLAGHFLALARSGGLETLLVGRSGFYPTDQTKPMLLLSDGGLPRGRGPRRTPGR